MKYRKTWLLCLLMLCLTSCPGYCQTSETVADAVRVTRGWTATADGYYLTDTAMRDTVAGWTEARKVADVREQALIALRAEIETQSKDTARLIRELQTEIAAERKLYNSRIRRGKVQGFVIGAVLGFGGGYLVRRNNP